MARRPLRPHRIPELRNSSKTHSDDERLQYSYLRARVFSVVAMQLHGTEVAKRI